MILLEFRFRTSFQKACAILGRCGVAYLADPAVDDCGANVIYFFEEDIRTDAQSDALTQARLLEAGDRGRRNRNLLPNLAIPL